MLDLPKGGQVHFDVTASVHIAVASIGAAYLPLEVKPIFGLAQGIVLQPVHVVGQTVVNYSVDTFLNPVEASVRNRGSLGGGRRWHGRFTVDRGFECVDRGHGVWRGDGRNARQRRE
jgi:hypothetical protein